MVKAEYPIEEVRWVDSSSLYGWNEVEDRLEFLKFSQSLECRTVGYLILETDEKLCYAIGYAEEPSKEPGQLSTVMSIPKVALLERKVLRGPKD